MDPPMINRAGAARVEAAIMGSNPFNFMNIIALAVIIALAYFLYTRYKRKSQKADLVPPAPVTETEAAPVPSTDDSTKEE
jgi:hypothetical protein